MACSVCWSTAFTPHNAAYLRALDQVELVFTCLARRFYFCEKIAASELVGILLIVCAIVLILLAG